jgi:hypothetical protein
MYYNYMLHLVYIEILMHYCIDGNLLNICIKTEIAATDFDSNLELVSVWADYLSGINWIYKNKADGKEWIATEDGKTWIQKYYSIIRNNE